MSVIPIHATVERAGASYTDKSGVITVRDAMLFACHQGLVDKQPIGFAYPETALPLAFMLSAAGKSPVPDALFGLHSHWEESPSGFWEILQLRAFQPPADSLSAGGLWVYEIGWGWPGLSGGTIRRPNDVESAAYASGLCPWKDGVLL